MRNPQRDVRELFDQQNAYTACGELNDHRNQAGYDYRSEAKRQFIRKI